MRLAIVVALLSAMVLAAATVPAPRGASAHALLVRSDPIVNAQLIDPPSAISASFSESLDHSLSTMSVEDGLGERFDDGEVRFPGQDDAQMSVGIEGELSPGFYVVLWETLSSVDGHYIKGSFPFTVLNPDGSEPSGPRPEIGGVTSGGQPKIDATIGRIGIFSGIVALVGALAFAVLVVPGAAASLAREWQDPVRQAGRRHSLRVIWPALALLAVAGIIELVAQARQLGGIDLVDTVLADTDWGERWLQRHLVLTIIVTLVVVATRLPPERGSARRTLLGAALLGGLGYMLLVSLVSHGAAAQGSFWAVAADFLHISAAAVWIGMLIQLALTLVWARGNVPDAPRTVVLAAHLQRFSVIAAVSVIALLAAGTFSALVEIPTPEAMVDTPYGRALFAKLALVGLLLPVAGLNAFILRPRALRQASASGREAVERLRGLLVRTVWLEAALAAGILVIVGVLTQYPPARVVEESRAFVEESVEAVVGYESASQAGDLGVNMSIAPNAVGTNSYQVFLFPEPGQALSEVLQVRLRFKPPDPTLGPSEIIADEVNPNFFQATGAFFVSEGDWEVQVDIRRAEVDDVSTFFRVPVSGAGIAGGGKDDRFAFPLVNGSWSVVAALGLLAGAAIVTVPAQGWPRIHVRVARWLRMTGVTCVVIGLALILGVHRHVGLNDEQAREGNPVAATEESVARGRELYEQNCTQCHGLTGRGDGPLADTLSIPPADFDLHVPYHTDQFFFQVITRGFGDVMPSFGGQFSEEDRWNLINFLRATHSLEAQQQ
ncbi:MAG: CopD family protein [Dehalococcoidia bacterium]